ncbi:MAG TPA: hypothetical protein VIA06_05170 [Candidatus Dormibacteraeota bacterium]|jgi:hypothetical protein|nr:hypothetical protein [Candidatus Dormibacteraeota bacterium]
MAIHEPMREVSAARGNGFAHGVDDAARRSLMRLTDRAIGRLEELNLADRGGSRPDADTARTIKTTLAALPADARRRFGCRSTVQEALDGLFDAQEELMRPRQREQWMSPYDAA